MSGSSAPAAATSVLFGLLAIALLTVMDGLVKAASGYLSTLQILWLRFALTALFAVGLTLLLRSAWPRRDALPAHGLRALLMIVSNGAFFYALAVLPLADVFALSFTAPIFIALFGAALLDERLSARALVGIAVAFVGMLVIATLQRDGATARPWAGLVAGCVAPIVYALSIVLLRKQATGEKPLQIVLAQSGLIGVLLLPVVALTGWPELSQRSVPQVTVIAALSLAGYLTIVRALAGLTAVRYSVIEYTGLLWAAAIGLAFFGEVPGWHMWLGAGMIAGGALLALTEREKVKA